MRENFFTVKVTEHWSRLPREIVYSASLELRRSDQDTILSDVLWVMLHEQRGLDGLQWSLPTSTIL